MKICQNLQKSHRFYQEKVDFPASKFSSECFLHLLKYCKGVEQSLDMLVYVYKIFFGRLDRILETIWKRYQNSHIARLFVHFSSQARVISIEAVGKIRPRRD